MAEKNVEITDIQKEKPKRCSHTLGKTIQGFGGRKASRSKARADEYRSALMRSECMGDSVVWSCEGMMASLPSVYLVGFTDAEHCLQV